jgi:hypothetical protein
VDNDPFPVSAIDLQGAKVLVWPKQAELTKGKNVIIDEERPKSCEDKIWSREVVVEKDADGKDVLKITINSSELGGKPATWSKIGALFSKKQRVDQSDRSNYDEPVEDAQAKESRSGWVEGGQRKGKR